MGLRVYVHPPWVPSLLASRKKCQLLLLSLGRVHLGVRSVHMPMVSRYSIRCFKFAIQIKAFFPQQQYGRAIQITEPVSVGSWLMPCLIMTSKH